MSFFNSKLRYALCAAIDLALQSTTLACQSREIAARQDIPGPYLDQILASLKSSGIVKSVRGAGGGYSLARPAEKIRAGDVVRAILREDKLFASSEETDPTHGVSWVVHDMEEQVESAVTSILDSLTLADLAQRKQGLDDALSIMPAL